MINVGLMRESQFQLGTRRLMPTLALRVLQWAPAGTEVDAHWQLESEAARLLDLSEHRLGQLAVWAGVPAGLDSFAHGVMVQAIWM